MKIATILVPAFLPRPYPGATPAPYLSGTVDKFERALACMSPLVVRHTCTRLLPDPAGRFAHPEIASAYDVMFDPETQTIAEVIDLTLKSFGLESVTVICDGDAEPFNKASVDELMNGLHPWNDV